MLTAALKTKIASLLASEDVVLFMKGTRDAPQCGFSAAVIEILNDLGPKYRTVDVLSDLERARITHFFFSYFPRLTSPDQARLYSPLYEDVAFRSHFTLVHAAEDGLLFAFHPRATTPEPKYLLPIPPAARDVFVWR